MIDRIDSESNEDMIQWDQESGENLDLIYEIKELPPEFLILVKGGERLYLILEDGPKFLSEGTYHVMDNVSWGCYVKKGEGILEPRVQELLSKDNFEVTLVLSILGDFSEPGRLIEQAYKQQQLPMEFLGTEMKNLIKDYVAQKEFLDLLNEIELSTLPQVQSIIEEKLKGYGFQIKNVKIKTIEGKPVQGIEKIKKFFPK